MKVFNVLVNDVYSFDTTNTIYSFFSKEDAETKVKELRDNYMEQIKPDPEYCNIAEDKDAFECYLVDCYGEEHYSVQIHECEIKDSACEEICNYRVLAMRQMEQELIEIVKEHGDDGYLDVEDVGMMWTEECDGECYKKEIFALEVSKTWDEVELLVVHMYGGDDMFHECDREDLGYNLADYIYSEIKTYFL